MFDLSYWFIWLDFLTYVNQLKSFIEEYTRYTRNKMVEQAQFSDNRICSMKVIRELTQTTRIRFCLINETYLDRYSKVCTKHLCQNSLNRFVHIPSIFAQFTLCWRQLFHTFFTNFHYVSCLIMSKTKVLCTIASRKLYYRHKK